MRILNGALAAVLILFAAVQYNDPDGMFWALIYGSGAVVCLIAAFAPRILGGLLGRGIYTVALAAAIYGCIVFWPDTPDWWMEEVWWNTETAREGMGMMILVAALILAGPRVLRGA